MLTGRNHHRVGNGQIAELANDWDGYSGRIPRSSALAAEVLKDYGYSTEAFGKWHNTPAKETTAGPFEELDYYDKMPFKFNGTIGQVRVEHATAKKELAATAHD
jgi:arylsulfatase A-like enzyme